MDFSLLMSTYAKDHPEELAQAFKSIWEDQSQKPTEIVIVKDGPLNPELDAVIEDFSRRAPVQILPLPKNVGLGRALAEGIKKCRYENVARMDGDDIALPDRFEKQCCFMTEHPEITVSGGMIQEFSGTLDHFTGKRVLPVSDSEIKIFMKRRNPFNHMTVFFRRDAAIAAGNYVHLLGYEDYWLWCRILKRGGKGANLPDVLVYARTGGNMFKRRRGWKLALAELKLATRQHGIGILSQTEMFRNLLLKVSVRLMPLFILKIIYSKLREA